MKPRCLGARSRVALWALVSFVACGEAHDIAPLVDTDGDGVPDTPAYSGGGAAGDPRPAVAIRTECGCLLRSALDGRMGVVPPAFWCDVATYAPTQVASPQQTRTTYFSAEDVAFCARLHTEDHDSCCIAP